MDTTALAERLDRSAGELRGDNARELIDLLREAASALRAGAEPVRKDRWHGKVDKAAYFLGADKHHVRVEYWYTTPDGRLLRHTTFCEVTHKSDAERLAELLLAHPQPATPATVTDEDVERACDASWPTARFSVESMTDWAHADPRRRDHHKRVIRAALESFANKEPTDE